MKRKHRVRPAASGRDQRSVTLWGRHAVTAAIANANRSIEVLYCTPASEAGIRALAGAAGRPEPLVLAARDLADRVPENAVHQGLVAVARPLAQPDPMDLIDGSAQVFVVLDQITDPQNAGAVLRSAAAFGAAGLIMQDRHSPPIDGIMAKAASGALEHVPVVLVTNLARTLDRMKRHGVWCIGLSGSAAAAFTDLGFDGPVALVLGAEGPGLRRLTQDRCDAMVRLPTNARFPTLNISNAAAIALYEFRRQTAPCTA